ncbi:MAG: hypothetical protein WCJ99_15430 [Betaproteobacteria bacterium]
MSRSPTHRRCGVLISKVKGKVVFAAFTVTIRLSQALKTPALKRGFLDQQLPLRTMLREMGLKR